MGNKNKILNKEISYKVLFMILVVIFILLNSFNVYSAPIISSSTQINNGLSSGISNNLISNSIISSNELNNGIVYETDISISKPYYFRGELVDILFSGPIIFDEGIYLEMYNSNDPTYYYKYLGIVDNKISFYADILGTYTLKLYKSNFDGTSTLISEKSFNVYQRKNNDLCIYYIADSTIKIDLSKYYSSQNIPSSKIYLSQYSLDSLGNENFVSQYLYNYNPTSFNFNSDSNEKVIYFGANNVGKYYLMIDDSIVDCFIVKNVLSDEELESQLLYSGKIGANSGINYLDNNFDVNNFNSNPDISGFYDALNIPMPGIVDLISLQEKLRIRNYYESKDSLEIYSKIGQNKNLDNTKELEFKTLLQEKISTTKPYIGIIGSDGSIKNSYIVIKNENDSYVEGNILEINSIMSDASDSRVKFVDMYFTSSTLKKIRMNNVALTSGVDLSYEDFDNTELKMTGSYLKEYEGYFNDNSDFLDVFAIDPRRVDFEYAEVQFTAVGNALWKCKEYDFSNKNCYGSFVKIMDLIPGKDYTFILTPEDPVFTQTGYLLNPTFENNTNSWTAISESGTPTFAWVASDSGRSGVAQIQATGNNRNWFGYYNQTFNLSIPSGTQLVNVSFFTWWRINTYTLALPGNITFWIRNGTTTNCNFEQAFSSTTSWANITLQTNGSNGCFLGNFSSNNNFQMVLRCNLKTQGGGGTKDVRCVWDDASITAYYLDIESPIFRSLNDTPDPVNYGNNINITTNITDNIQIDVVLIQINNTNYTMNYSSSSGLYYIDRFNTTIKPGIYNYTIFANDTSNNLRTNNSGFFTINDTLNPKLNIIAPISSSFTTISNTSFYYNVSDESGIRNCSLRVENVIRSTNTTILENTNQTFNYTLIYGVNYWNITCFDNSTNILLNTSITRNITLDNRSPLVILRAPSNNTWVSGYTSRIIYFNYTPIDDYFENCSLYGNFTGTFEFNKSTNTPLNNTINSLDLVLSDSIYVWNILCCDRVGTCAFNTTNFTARVDSTPPSYSNNNTNPVNGSTWSYPQTYRFNITWTDILNPLSSVWIENNFSGTMQNNTVLPSGSIYSYSVSNLSAGSYYYKWYSNDTLNNINSTEVYIYVVAKASPSINLSLNYTESDISIGQGSTINLSAILAVPSIGYIELYLDNNLTNSGSSPLSNMTTFNDQRVYNVTAIYPSTQNYSYFSISRYVTVVDTTPPTVGLGNPVNDSWNPSQVTFYYTPNDNIDIINCTLIINGTNNDTKNSVIAIQNNITITLTDGIYNWTVGCRDGYNNYGFNSTQKVVKIDTIAPSAFNLSTPTNDTVSKNTTPLFNWTQTSETNFFNYTLQIDNNEGFSSINYIYTNSLISSTTYQIGPSGSLSDGVWYWRVIAYDQALNNRISNQYFSYTVDNVPPTLTIVSPQNNYYGNSLSQNFAFTITETNDILNCSLIIGGTIVDTNYSVNKSLTQNFTYNFGVDGYYNWSVSCIDEALNIQTTTIRYITIDTTPPSSFSLVSPQNDSRYNNQTPTFNWTATTELNFNNYTVQVSDSSSFTNINYSYSTNNNVSNTSYNSGILTDYYWYWRVIAFDNSGNSFISSYFIYDLDATPPSTFNLQTPVNNTFSTSNSLTLNWSQTSDNNFVNYTIYVSDNSSFNYNNFTYSTTNISNTTSLVTWPINNIWYWRVIAFDNYSNNYTTTIFRYTADNTSPIVSLMYPANNTLWNTSFSVPFIFNVSDLSDITNCSLIINGAIDKTSTSISKNINQTITTSLVNGNYNWTINCTDAAGLTGSTTGRNITLNVQLPRYRFYETSPSGTVAITPPANINLSTVDDGTENTMTQSIGSGVEFNMANATITFNASGFILYAGTIINLSGSFEASNQNRGYVNWIVYIRNSSGLHTICSTPSGTSGQLITTRNAKETEISNCTSPSYDIRFNNGDSLVLRVNIFNNGASTTFIHYVDNGNPSYIELLGFKLGILNVTLVNLTDQTPGEGYSFIERCNVTCSDGYCLDTDVHFRINNSDTGSFTDIGLTGKIILNGSQENPYQLSLINSSNLVNASLFANIYSFNNSFMCVGESQYSLSNSTIKNITVIDITAPSVVLTSPSQGFATDPGVITFQYIPTDPRLFNCSLYLNLSSGWNLNQTNSSPINASTNNFTVNLSYGVYPWNVRCCDTSNNCAFNTTNRTLYVAGDLSIYSVYFNNQEPAEGEQVTVFGVVRNLANKNETNVLVRFYLGDPDVDGVQIGENRTINITGLSDVIVNITWQALVGTNVIYAKVDPLNDIIESNDNNNKGFNSTFTAIWQYYYGNVSAILTSIGVNNTALFNWTKSSNLSGNIYIADSDSVISWTTLQALTRDTSGNLNSNTTNDFENLDGCLNTTIFNDDVNTTYSINGLPAQTSTYFVYENIINNVPEAQSTNNTNFYSGLLWDTSDAAQSYYNCSTNPSLREDIIFVTKLNIDSIGKYGLYDYELRVPGELAEYKGATNNIALYYEIE